MMQTDTNLAQLLMEIGYLAAGYGFFKEAETIFCGVRAARPDSEFPFIGMAVVKMSQGKNHEAVKFLSDHALGKNPESSLAKSFLGMALSLAGDMSESREMLMQVMSSGSDPPAADMAEALLSEMNE